MVEESGWQGPPSSALVPFYARLVKENNDPLGTLLASLLSKFAVSRFTPLLHHIL